MLRLSRMIDLGTRAPKFTLPDGGGRTHSLDEIAGSKPVLVAFICNHCPFVKHMAGGLADFAREYQAKGLAVVAISSNDVASHPEDGPREMAEFARSHDFTFPYLYDESQRVALDYGAICTPDLFLFDGERRLVYRGQFDSSRPDRNRPPLRTDLPVTGVDLRAAADAVLAGKALPKEQSASAGCGIKWKPENEPDWA
ncbi:MAG TPA: thioredoxin family protein [Steroidobacteraceae bacterium]|nr:thioredoxin family protein [Steroidobacteraceae bacterium]